MRLIRELDARLEVLERIGRDVIEGMELVRRQSLSRVALANLALRLQQLYGCLEDLAYRVSAEVNGEVPTGPESHKALLERVCLHVPGKREALFRAADKEDLEELLKFRHFIHKNYGAELDRDKMVEVGERALRVVAAARADVKRFRDRLESGVLPNSPEATERAP